MTDPNVIREAFELADLKTFDPKVFKEDEKYPQELCDLMLTFSVFCNDFKDITMYRIAIVENKPAKISDNKKAIGQFFGAQNLAFSAINLETLLLKRLRKEFGSNKKLLQMPIKQHLHFNIPDNIDARIWRYMSLEKFIKLINDNALYFCRSDLFEDQHEGSYTTNAREYRKQFYSGATKGWYDTTMPTINENLKKCTFISCWHVNEDENIHMWQSYAEKDKTVAIVSSITNIKKHILDTDTQFLLGLVNYIDYDKDLVSEVNAFAPFFCKRKEFSGEREFRIIKERFIDVNKVIKGEVEMPQGINIPISIPGFIEEIRISPFVSKDTKKNFIKDLRKIGLTNKFQESFLNSKPIY